LREDAPENFLHELENKVWEWTVSSSDLPALKQKHTISGTIRRSDGVQVRVVSADRPDVNAQNVSPNLEDAYLFFVGGKN
jgi:ABC-2 type transport system ATP-binding protein